MSKTAIFQVENDTINNTDKHLTNTLKFSIVDDLNTSLKLFNLENTSYAFTINQDTYTPEDTKEDDPKEFDLPYAGYLYSSFTYINWQASKYHSLGLTLGYIGDDTQTDELQNSLHKVIGSNRARGWIHQLDNKTTFQVTYNFGTMLYEETMYGRDIKVSKDYEITLGNFERSTAVSYQLRSGKNYPTNFTSLTNCKIESLSNRPKEFGFSYGFGVSLIYIDYNYLAEQSRDFQDLIGKVLVQDELSFSIYQTNQKLTFFVRAFELAKKESSERSILGGIRFIKYNF